jgi:hypothetical protein
MSRQALTLNGVQKFVDDGSAENLGTLDGITLKHIGPFLFADGNGTDAAVTNTLAIGKLIPPAKVGATNAAYAYSAGICDSW